MKSQSKLTGQSRLLMAMAAITVILSVGLAAVVAERVSSGNESPDLAERIARLEQIEQERQELAQSDPTDDLGYDSAADPFSQLEEARIEAAADGKHILVIAGGDWCVWCHWLDAFLAANADVDDALKETFVVLKVYFGERGQNEAFFATLPEAIGYPHFWVLDSEGELLVSQNTVPLEDGERSYDKGNFMSFIDEWKATL